MLIQNLHKPFEIEVKEVNVCPVDEHRHTFFELIYIIKGNGTQYVNNHSLEYQEGHLFLLTPREKHHFICATTTSFLFIRFNDIYLEGQKVKTEHTSLGEWVPKMEYIFQNSSHLPGCILREQGDRPLVQALVDAIIRENVNQKTLHKEIVQQLVNTLLTVVARNISLSLPEKKQESSALSLDILHYIHQNIYSPELLRAATIASHFNISLNYISEYFKKQTGENLQQYITNYKLRLVETRLQYSDMRMNEIVSELGFTDESHLHRTFKKYKGLSPSEFRRKTRTNHQYA